MISQLRAYVGPVKKILAWPFLKAGFTPTGVGLLGLLAAGLAALGSRLGLHGAAFWVALLAVLSDLIDGEVARAQESQTPLGNYLDAVGDRTRECLLLFGLLPLYPNLVALAIIGSCLTSFAKARCSLVRVLDNRDWPVVGDHPDRALLLLIAYFFAPACGPALGLLALLSWCAFLGRVVHARQLIVEARPEELLPYLRDDVRT